MQKGYSKYDCELIRRYFKNRGKINPDPTNQSSNQYQSNLSESIKSNKVYYRNISNLFKNEFVAIPISTDKKLNQILLNSKQSISKIKKKIFPDSQTQILQNDFHHKMKLLLNERNLIQNKENNDQKNITVDNLLTSIERLKKWNKKYNLPKSKIKILQEENNRMPPLCKYTPDYNSIYKHIPVVYFNNHNDNFNPKKLLKNNSQKKITYNKNMIEYTNESKEEKKNIYITKIKNISNNSEISERYLDNSHDEENNSIIYYNNNNNNNNNINNNKKKLRKNISAPNFRKMTGREGKFLFNNVSSCLNYSPNYNAIFGNSGVIDYKPINRELKLKKNLLRKIINNTNPPSEYLLLPSLNKKE